MRYLQFAKNLPEELSFEIDRARQTRFAYLRGEATMEQYKSAFDVMLAMIKAYNATAKQKLPVPHYLSFA